MPQATNLKNTQQNIGPGHAQGVRPPLGKPPATGKSFRVARACDARCLDVKRNQSEIRGRPAFPFSLFAAVTAHVGDSASSAPTPAMSLEDIDRDLNVRDFDLKTGRRSFKSGFSSLGGEVPNLCRSTFFILPPKKPKMSRIVHLSEDEGNTINPEGP